MGTLLLPAGGTCVGLPGFGVASLVPNPFGANALLMIDDATMLTANAAAVIANVNFAAATPVKYETIIDPGITSPRILQVFESQIFHISDWGCLPSC
jgi:hypothetical protein